MADAPEPDLALADWIVLCLICEQPAYGFVIAQLLAADGDLGRIWRVTKFRVYVAIGRLSQLGLVNVAAHRHSSAGPPIRSLSAVTPAGRRAAGAWRLEPAAHGRDIRSELLIKLALIDRAGADPAPLLAAQRSQLAPVAAALDARAESARGFDHTLALWRHETVTATMRFLDAVQA